MTDYISREEARRFFQVSENCQDCTRDPYKCQHYDEWNVMDICSTLDDIPAADVEEVRHGRWEKHMNIDLMIWCSECGWMKHQGDKRNYNYCPNCGAKNGRRCGMIKSDGYSLTYYANRNKIVIILPQTLKSLTNTVTMVKNRKTELTAEEQATILAVVRAIMDGGADDGKT